MIQVSPPDSKYRGIDRVHSTLEAKRKSVGVCKGRLCVRGDTVPIAQTSFASMPTASRCGVEVVRLIASQSQRPVRALDISQAFLQEGNLHNHDRMVVLPPPMIKLHWGKSLQPPDTELKSLPISAYGRLLLRPLYGGRDAPMRWFQKLPQVMTDDGILESQSDVCIFTHSADRLLGGLLLAHEGGLLFTEPKTPIALLTTALETFRNGDLEDLAVKVAIIFTGMLIEKQEGVATFLPRQPYVQESPTKNIDRRIRGNKIADLADLRIAFRQGLGSLIWPRQTRPEVGFTIDQIAEDRNAGLPPAVDAKEVCRKYSRIVKHMRNRHGGIRYTQCGSKLPGSAAIQELMSRSTTAFDDAGFGSIGDQFSAECNSSALCRALKRDGAAHFHGGLFDNR